MHQRWRPWGSRASPLATALATMLAGWSFLAGCADGGPSPGVSWTDCGPGEAQCAAVEVPLDHARPDGDTIRILLARLPATGPGTRIGSLVVDFGGPGPAMDILRNLAAGPLPTWLAELRTRFDLVAFNRRGFDSDHQISCLDGPAADALRLLDMTPDMGDEEAALLDRLASLGAACADAVGPLADHVSSADVARDLDLIRAALGDSGLSFLGLSYGTLLGAHYASAFPDRTRAIALDAPLEPDRQSESLMAAAGAWNDGLERFLADCAARTDCAFHSGGDPWTAYDGLLAALDAAPLEVPGSHALSEWDVLAVTRLAIGSEAGSALLATGLSEAARGNGRRLLELVDQAVGRGTADYGHLIEQSAMISCSDTTRPVDRVTVTGLGARLAREMPRARFVAFEAGLCLGWPATGSAPLPARIPANGPTVLVIGGTLDSQAPYAWAVAVAGTLGNAVLVTHEGREHTLAGLAEPNPCLEQALTRYLIDLDVPSDGLTC